ncbi:hypothetical protein GCM10010358_16700 [Streptomyces minutiscleroticus]|uniref:Uncharacterized protein n=1 Tax=Streptomyces minutiscleroticus TaxID=68238 RepID=A0A918KGS1_9ACTN|nr:hypothetical protein GCM10010358_16700 [Streptomyces minutiscleroticus]
MVVTTARCVRLYPVRSRSGVTGTHRVGRNEPVRRVFPFGIRCFMREAIGQRRRKDA